MNDHGNYCENIIFGLEGKEKLTGPFYSKL